VLLCSNYRPIHSATGKGLVRVNDGGRTEPATAEVVAAHETIRQFFSGECLSALASLLVCQYLVLTAEVGLAFNYYSYFIVIIFVVVVVVVSSLIVFYKASSYRPIFVFRYVIVVVLFLGSPPS
jgi:hypothetical protein